MFKFRKKKLVPEIARVEDLRVGDQLQLKPGTVREVIEVRELRKSDRSLKNSPQYAVVTESEDPKDLTQLYVNVLFGEQNVIVWK